MSESIKKKVVIIIPTYNEEQVIEETIHRVFDATRDADHDIHLLIFDSHSTDKTLAIVRHLQKHYTSLHLKTEPSKTGLGSAYHQAMSYALHHLNADVIVEFDADLSHQPQYLRPMINLLDHFDVVVGSRYVKGGSIPKNWGWYRQLLSKLGNWAARLVLTPKLKDFTSGFRLVRRQALLHALPKTFISNHYAYKIELFWRLYQNKTKIMEYPIAFVDRTLGQSKLPANTILDSLRVLFFLRLETLKTYLKMCTVGLTGIGVQFLMYHSLRPFMEPFYAVQIAIIAAILNNYLLNNKYTFKHASPRLKSFFWFISYSILMVEVQSHWLDFTVRYWGTGFLKENILMAFGMILGSILNYFYYSRCVWQIHQK